MNNYYNFYIPTFNLSFGSDWMAFKTIVDDNVDYTIKKTVELYNLRDISRMPIQALEKSLRLRNILTTPEESVSVKKMKLRKFTTNFRNKGTAAIYLDYAEAIVGTRGTTYNAYVLGQTAWGVSSWNTVPATPTDDDRVWATREIIYQIYIDVKTTDDDLLDQIVDIYRQPFLLPAFYDIYLIDSDYNILRSI